MSTPELDETNCLQFYCINVKGPGSNVNQRDSALGKLMTHALRQEVARLMGSRIQGNIIRNNTA